MNRYLAILCYSMALLVAACGQPGPLYLPQEEPAAPAPPAEESPPSGDLQTSPEPADPKSENYTEPTP